MFSKNMLINTLNNFFSLNLSLTSLLKVCTFSLISKVVTINYDMYVMHLIIFDFKFYLIFKITSFLNKCFRNVTLLLTLFVIIIINLWTKSYRCKTFNTTSTSLFLICWAKRNLNKIKIFWYRNSMLIKYVVIFKNAKWLKNVQTFNARNTLILNSKFWNIVSRISFARCFTSSSKKIRREISTFDFKKSTRFLKNELSMTRNDKLTFKTNLSNRSLNLFWEYRTSDFFSRIDRV
jgi:hypothetical protein